MPGRKEQGPRGEVPVNEHHRPWAWRWLPALRPCRSKLRDELLKLSEVSVTTVREVLNRYGVAVLITKEEDERLTQAGLRDEMPAGWDGSNALARYKAVGIELVENDSTRQTF